MPEEGVPFRSKDKLLTTEEIFRLITIISQMGVYKIRFTGGEPLLRKDLPKLVKFANQISLIQSVHLTTNGLLLGKYINDLEQAGLTGINISLDTLKAERFKTITRREGLDIVMDGIEKAIK